MKFTGFEHGMGIGGWLTNYKRFNVLPNDKRLVLTVGDFEHFDTYITEKDVAYIASLGMDHIRLGFDQIVVESVPYTYRDHIFELIANFVGWCKKYNLNVVLNLHKATETTVTSKKKWSCLTVMSYKKDLSLCGWNLKNEFANCPEVAFELLNEVRNIDSEKWMISPKKHLTSYDL